MMIMRPPQHGQGCECVGGSLASVLPALAASLRGFGTASSSRARAMLSAREVLANSSWHRKEHRAVESVTWVDPWIG